MLCGVDDRPRPVTNDPAPTGSIRVPRLTHLTSVTFGPVDDRVPRPLQQATTGRAGECASLATDADVGPIDLGLCVLPSGKITKVQTGTTPTPFVRCLMQGVCAAPGPPSVATQGVVIPISIVREKLPPPPPQGRAAVRATPPIAESDLVGWDVEEALAQTSIRCALQTTPEEGVVKVTVRVKEQSSAGAVAVRLSVASVEGVNGPAQEAFRQCVVDQMRFTNIEHRSAERQIVFAVELTRVQPP